MSTTPRPPLLSDDEIKRYSMMYTIPYRYEAARALRHAKGIYEAARAKDAELIQMLVDEVAAWMQPNLDERFRGEQWHQSKRILDAAAEANFKPTEP